MVRYAKVRSWVRMCGCAGGLGAVWFARRITASSFEDEDGESRRLIR